MRFEALIFSLINNNQKDSKKCTFLPLEILSHGKMAVLFLCKLSVHNIVHRYCYCYRVEYGKLASGRAAARRTRHICSSAHIARVRGRPPLSPRRDIFCLYTRFMSPRGAPPLTAPFSTTYRCFTVAIVIICLKNMYLHPAFFEQTLDILFTRSSTRNAGEKFN